MEPLIVSLVLAVMFVMFVTERIPNELTALLAVLFLVFISSESMLSVLLGVGVSISPILAPEDAIAGFANAAVITVASMFVISAALIRTGAIGFIGDRIIALSRGNPQLVLVLSMISVACCSAFMNNTPVVVLFVPIILRVCSTYGISPSKFLIPVSYASILGGTCTLIGTSTNILVSDIAGKYTDLGLHRLGMFEISPVGIPIALAGLVFVALFGRRFLPDRKTVTSTLMAVEQKTFMTELEIQAGSPCTGKTVAEAFLSSYEDLAILEVIRGERIIYPPLDQVVLKEKDILLTKGTASEIIQVQQDKTAVIAPELGPDRVRLIEKNYTLAEIVIMPLSQFVGKTIDQVQFKRRYDVNVIAILRRGRHMHIQEQIRNVILAVGDTLLVQGGEEGIAKLRQAENILLLEGIGESIAFPKRAPIAIAALVWVVVGATLNLMPIYLLALIGATFIVATKCLPLKEAYRSLDASVLVLIAATIGFGSAMQNTGTARLYAEAVISAVEPMGPIAVIASVLALTSLLTEFISNNASAVLMTHVAIAAAIGLGYQPMPFVMAVLFGASACFATPIGYQTNLFVYGPGGYRFTDYMILGIPINILVVAVSTPLIPLVWPLTPLG